MNMPTYLSGALFMKAQRLLRANVTTCLDQYNVSPTLWVLLGVVKQSRDGIRLTEVAEQLEVKAPLVTLLAQELISRDFAKLSTHPSDKRVKILMLTIEGKTFIKKVDAELEQSLLRLLAGVTQTELDGFKAVLDTIVANNGRKQRSL